MERRDTIELLREIDNGCRMAVSSFEQMLEFDLRQELKELLRKYQERHEKMQDEATGLLHELDEEGRDPSPMAKAMSWLTTEMKMNLKEDSTQAAKLMMDGCNMGIQSIGEAISKYPSASDGSVKLARKLMKSEEDFMAEIKEYL